MTMDAKVRASISDAIRSHAGDLAKPGVLSVRPGFQMAAGWPTRKPAVVVTVGKKTDAIPAADRLPETLGGFAVDVREASPLKQLQITDPMTFAAASAATPPESSVPTFPDEHKIEGKALAPVRTPAAKRPAKPQVPYAAPPGSALSPIDEQMTLTCHASPDAGWPTLGPFLGGTESVLTVGLYDFTSAHVLDTVSKAMASKTLALVLDDPIRNPTADQSDPQTADALRSALGAGLRFAWALDDRDPFASSWIVPNAYHIKVAVRDHKAVWLSSGNWNNSNQPDIDPVTNGKDADHAREGDRDWHVIVESASLASVFEAYLENDLQVATAHQAAPATGAAAHAVAAAAVAPASRTMTPPFGRFFAPAVFTRRMTVQPLLTPDPGVYSSAVLKLIDGAQRSLFIQTQYIHPSDRPEDADFAALVQAVIGRQRKGLDVRIILSEFETGGFLEQLQLLGLDLSAVRIQSNVHNKGIVVDSSTVLVSSQNWSADGVLRNRDAGLIISDAEVAAYFEQIFVHDWTTLAHQSAAD